MKFKPTLITKKLFPLFFLSLSVPAFSFLFPVESQSCTRVVYECGDMVATGRTMDWKEDPQTNIYVFPRGERRSGGLADNAMRWISKYGSVVAAGYDIGVCDGMNEEGLVANMLFLPESVYTKDNEDRKVMGISIWTQYILDNFATVEEAVEELSKDTFYLDAPMLPNGSKSTLHMAISDRTGNNAIIEYLDGIINIYEGKDYRILTNSPAYNLQLAVNDYWQQVGGLNMLPGTNKSSDRFARGSFYVGAVTQSESEAVAVPALMSVMRNVSVPYGISMPDNPYISSTRWRIIADQKNLVYYFENTLPMYMFHLNLKDIDFTEGSGERVLKLSDGTEYNGDATLALRISEKPFTFLLLK